VLDEPFIHHLIDHADAIWCMRVVSIVCKQWWSTIKWSMDRLIQQHAIQRLRPNLEHNLANILGRGRLINDFSINLFTSPAIWVTVQDNRAHSSLWNLQICKHDPCSRTTIWLEIALNYANTKRYLHAIRPPTDSIHIRLQITTQRRHLNYVAVLSNDALTLWSCELFRAQDSTAAYKPDDCIGSANHHPECRAVRDHFAEILWFMASPELSVAHCKVPVVFS
jgi:hypothetical protein